MLVDYLMAVEDFFLPVFFGSSQIGPVFRAEKSNTHRHLTEFTGLDFEMVIDEHYMEIVRMIDGLFASIFEGLQTRFAKELEAVQQLYPFEPFKFRPSGNQSTTSLLRFQKYIHTFSQTRLLTTGILITGENLVLEFPQGIALLREHGIEIGDYDDMNSETERTLGKIVREKYDTDFFILTKYELASVPIYPSSSSQTSHLPLTRPMTILQVSSRSPSLLYHADAGRSSLLQLFRCLHARRRDHLRCSAYP